MSRTKFVSEFLTFLEARDARLLGWGFFDVAFDIAELESLLQAEGPEGLFEAWQTLAFEGHTMVGLIDDMAANGLLHLLPEDHDRFRTRFAEGVRLIARLRQMFRQTDWSTGPRLVSDIKLHLAPRRYPRRDQKPDDCWTDLAKGAADLPAIQHPAFEALAQDAAGQTYPGFAGFQRRAFARILSRYGKRGMTGAIVSAGTGSGKTKAFYVPAFLGVVADIARDPVPFTKIIAVYPRNVLLGDQLREALSEAAKLSPLLAARGLRPITFGALTGDTPPEHAFQHPKNVFLRNWERRTSSYRLPLLKSPRDGAMDLIWRDEDRQAGKTALFGASDQSGEPHVADGVLRLTRDAIRADPPDVLMLSIEMLHRELGNPAYSNVFGIVDDPRRSPRLMLLDEVHTYEGLSGAQIPWVLRRWQAAAHPSALQVVGLSATLRNAKAHLAAIAGLSLDRVEEFRPEDSPEANASELEIEGQEYNLAVKGNAASGTSLLATSIQCAMLLSRLLTPQHVAIGGDIAGSRFYAKKVFGFTDNLDGINRWYSDLSDAERNKRLPRLRAPDPTARTDNSVRATERARRQDGQVWDLPVALGHNLTTVARIDRCSSQDSGVNAGADIVLATSSLEVGYDDPEVGVVLHHKTPRSMASFLQRKGRAGRRRGTRPATVVVLSDYGVDRWTFQNSERLFEPMLERIALPILNPHVLRVQATAFLIDWLGRRIGRNDPFNYLRRPRADVRAQQQARRLLHEILEAGPALDQFRRDLVSLFRPAHEANGFEDRVEDVVDGVLWDEPRPVLRHAVPALLRKLEAEWSFADPGRKGHEDQGRSRPLPEFLPAASFSPLDGVEVSVRFANQPDRDEESLSAARAFFEACPGRVSKRFSVGRTELGYWLDTALNAVLSTAAVGPDGGDLLTTAAELFPERIIIRVDKGRAVYQPIAVTLCQKPAHVADSSNAQWEWQSVLQCIGVGVPLPVFLERSFQSHLGPVRAHLHRDGGGVRVLRHASSARFDVTFRDGAARRGRMRLDDAEAVGFEQTVDGIMFGINAEGLSRVPELDVADLARLRPEYFLHVLQTDETILNRAGPFMVGWLWQTSLAMLAATAVVERCSLGEAQIFLRERRVQAADRVLERIFGGLPVEEADDALDDAGAAAHGQAPPKARQRDRLLALWGEPAIRSRIEAAETYLWNAVPQPGFDRWLRERHLSTIAQAIRSAALNLVPDVRDDDLIVDVVIEGNDGTEVSENLGASILLTETGPGGLGQIEAVTQRMRAEPEAFEDAFRRAIDHCPRHEMRATLWHVLEAARGRRGSARVYEFGQALAGVRASRGHAEAEVARNLLARAMDAIGLQPTRQAMASVIGRLARPGSNEVTDALARGLNKAWRRFELRLGSSIDARVFAYLCVENRTLRRHLVQFLRHLAGGVPPAEYQLYATVQDMLLASCEDSCPECLDQGHLYGGLAKPSRAVTRTWLGLSVTRIPVEAGFGWLDHARESLKANGRVAIHAAPSMVAHAGRCLQILIAEEVERDFVMAPISLAQVARDPAGWTMLLRLRAAAHV